MTKLNTHIPIEYLVSDKLKAIETQIRYIDGEDNGDFFLIDKDTEDLDFNWLFQNWYNAPTIADIIDNAEELFGKEKVYRVYGPEGFGDFYSKKELDDIYSDHDFMEGGIFHLEIRYKYYEQQESILAMCQQDKSIKEISEYIIKNIKE